MDHDLVLEQVDRATRFLTSDSPPPRLKLAAEKAAAPLGAPNGAAVLKLLHQELVDHKDASSTGGTDPHNFVGAHPLTAHIQTHLERDHHPTLADRILRLLHIRSMSSDDPQWVLDPIVEELERVVRGPHAFNQNPAHAEMTDDARLIVVGDWGSGLLGAQRLADQMRLAVAEALKAGREVHVVHLGDVYYAGEKREYQDNVLGRDFWPVNKQQARRGAYSWALNGNHDMFSGGYHYFGTMLSDPRFRTQWSGSENQSSRHDLTHRLISRSPTLIRRVLTTQRPTSYFALQSHHWNIIGLDTAWSPSRLSMGKVAVLQDPQADQIARLVASAPTSKTLLLSHHQLMSIYEPDRIGPELPEKLKPVFAQGPVKAWLWGHEHRGMAFAGDDRVEFPRCLGHGGLLTSYPSVAPTLPPGSPPPPGRLWEADGDQVHLNGKDWYRNGFAVLDLQGAEIHARYLDDRGKVAAPNEVFR
jgi:Calcineurin-like phosphoesterase